MRGFLFGLGGSAVPFQLAVYFYGSGHEPWHLIWAATGGLVALAAVAWRA